MDIFLITYCWIKILSANLQGRCGRRELRGGVLFEEVADFEVEVWEVGCAAEPVVVGVDIGEGTSRFHRDLLANARTSRHAT